MGSYLVLCPNSVVVGKTKVNGSGDIRHNHRHHRALLCCRLLHHHRRHLQAESILKPLTQTPSNPTPPPPPPPPNPVRLEPSGRLMGFTTSVRLGLVVAVVFLLFGARLDVSVAHEGGSCPFSGHHSPAPSHSYDGHQCGDHGHHHHHGHNDHHDGDLRSRRAKLPEELAEEEDLRLYGFGSRFDHDHEHDHNHHHHHGGRHSGGSSLSGFSLWLQALSCSLLVSMASLICLILLPVLFVQGKPSKIVVDSLALFGAGAMLGDAFLHQLPHALGGEWSHSHDHHAEDSHASHFGDEHHHSLGELSFGMSVLGGILLFLVVEKLVRYVEDKSHGARLHHHHHHHKTSKKLNHGNDTNDSKTTIVDGKNENPASTPSEGMNLNEVKEDSLVGDDVKTNGSLRQRKVSTAVTKVDETVDSSLTNRSLREKESAAASKNLIFGYLNLFSDGVHNFTDGMTLGSAFLLHGSIGGWSRTLFLLAHELPQEVGDFGILVRSGFSVSKALFFNFLSALVALAGTALALILGQEGGQSSMIEGFTAGGFIYIAVGVIAEMNGSGSITLKSTLIQLTSLVLGMGVALGISIVE